MRTYQSCLASLLLTLYTQTSTAGNTAILHANNQASVQFLSQHNTLIYGNNPDHFPLHNLQGMTRGALFGLNKMIDQVYTKIELSNTTGNLSYTDRSLNLTSATLYSQQINLHVGYSFFSTDNTALSPYLLLGYQLSQLDTGGIANQGDLLDGMTDFFQSTRYGIGLLAQWATTPRWVLGSDLTLSSTYHPWFYSNTPQTNNKIIYQRANLASLATWQLALTSDYAITPNLHGLLGITYLAANWGNGISNSLPLTVPAQSQRILQYQLGLAYAFDVLPTTFNLSTDHHAALINANNEASINVGYVSQNYGEMLPGEPGYLDKQAGTIPQLDIQFTKTWENVYTQLAVSEAIGNTDYLGALTNGTPFNTTTRNSLTDLSGRIGYQFMLSPIFSITPYGVVGYHRWLRATNGVPDGFYLVNAYPEIYQHTWTGVGGLFQWAPTSQLVFNLDCNAGNTWHGQVHSWNSFYAPNTISMPMKLGARTYVMSAVGADYAFKNQWHLLANINYRRFNYGKSHANAYGVEEPTSNTRELTTTVGIGYSLN